HGRAARGAARRLRAASALQLGATALIGVALVLHVLGMRMMVWSIAAVLLAIVADRTLRAIRDRLTAIPEPSGAVAETSGEAGEEGDDEVGAATPIGLDRAGTVAAYRSVLHRAFDITVFAGAVVWLAAIWEVPVLELAHSGSIAGRILEVAI